MNTLNVFSRLYPNEHINLFKNKYEKVGIWLEYFKFGCYVIFKSSNTINITRVVQEEIKMTNNQKDDYLWLNYFGGILFAILSAGSILTPVLGYYFNFFLMPVISALSSSSIALNVLAFMASILFMFYMIYRMLKILFWIGFRLSRAL